MFAGGNGRSALVVLLVAVVAGALPIFTQAHLGSPAASEISRPAVGAYSEGTGHGLANSALPIAGEYLVTFLETGLPNGTSWFVAVEGATYTSLSPVIELSETNGAHAFTAGSAGDYSATPSSGTITVSGGPVNRTISFLPTDHAITFTESGLPVGTNWSVAVNGLPHFSTSPTIAFLKPSGTYGYTVREFPGYTASPAVGSLSVDGASTNQTIVFAVTTYTLAFTETGLPAGTTWAVTLGGVTLSSTSDTISFARANGSYEFTIAPVSGLSVDPSSGTVTVSGEPSGRTVAFTAAPTTGSPGSQDLSGNAGYVFLGSTVAAGVVVLVLAILLKPRGRPAPVTF